MGNVTDKIRNHIGEGEISEAIDTLNNYLKNVGGGLYNQSIHLKGRYKEYTKNRDLGMGDNQEEKAKISMAVLNLASDLEKGNLEKTPTKSDFEQHRPDPYANLNQPKTQPQTFQPQAPRCIAQCFFNMETMRYFLYENGQVFMFNPFTNQSMLVGMRMPPQNPNFAWTFYFTTTNVYYLVDHAGIIWGQNFGMPAQYGTVKYF